MTKIELNLVLMAQIKLLKTKGRFLYLKNLSVPHSKHFSSLL
jgi:hypothetical protein